MQIKCEISDYSKTFKNFLDPSKHKEATKTALKHISKEMERIIREEEPVLTGNLRESTHGESTDSEAYIICGADYWKYVNYGTSHQSPNPFILRTKSRMEKERIVKTCIVRAKKQHNIK